jgi:hypothetical protein
MNWEKLSEFPPPLVRCLARVKARGRAVRALTDQEVALGSSGLTTLQVREIAMTSDWGSIPIGQAKKFCDGCRFDPFSSADRNRAGAYMRSNPQFIFLRHHPHWKTTFLPLVNLIKNA